jgi:hypothetical protein
VLYSALLFRFRYACIQLSFPMLWFDTVLRSPDPSMKLPEPGAAALYVGTGVAVSTCGGLIVVSLRISFSSTLAMRVYC